MGSLRLHAIVAIVLAGLWGAGLAVVHLTGEPWFFARVESTMVDLRTIVRGVRKPPPDVLIVAIDDETVRQEGKYPLARSTLARLVDRLSSAGAKVIGLDILLLDQGDEDQDAALAASLSAGPTVIAGAAVFAAGSQRTPPLDGSALDGVPVADSFVLPLDRFGRQAALGVVNVATDFAGTPRLAPMVFRTADRIEASFPLQAASRALGAPPAFEPGSVVLGDRRIATDFGQRLPIGYYGPRGTIETIGASEVLAGTLPPTKIAGRVVVIGATVIGSGDVFPTPFDPVLPGVEVISTALSHLVAGDGPIRNGATRLADAAVAIVLPIVVVALLAWRRSLLGLCAIAIVAILWLVANYLFFRNGVWLSIALPLTAAVPPAIAFGASQMWFDRRRAQRFAGENALLQRFQAPALREWLARDPNFLAEPVRQEAAIVFIDLSGFTGLSEITSAAIVRELLDDFYRLVEQVAVANKGVITSFMGDGAMILFGLPSATAEDPKNALACATTLATRSRAWLAAQPVTHARGTGIKLGAHCGPIVASRLGGGSQQTITATGDAVNVASRLMEVAAQNHATLAFSSELQLAAGEALSAPGSLRGPIQSPIRGRAGELTVWLWSEVYAGTAS
jgi:adenylate cyclase